MMNNVDTNMKQIMEIFLGGISWNSLASEYAFQEWGRKSCQEGRCEMNLSIIKMIYKIIWMTHNVDNKQYQYQSKQFT